MGHNMGHKCAATSEAALLFTLQHIISVLPYALCKSWTLREVETVLLEDVNQLHFYTSVPNAALEY